MLSDPDKVFNQTEDNTYRTAIVNPANVEDKFHK